MVVEDEMTIGRLLEGSLRSNGYQVTWQRTAHGALRAAPSDLILLDLGLPDLDGVEVCRQLRVAQPGTVIVMLTARDEEMDVVVGLEAGADDYLTKPIRLRELHARIRAHLRRGTTSQTSAPSYTLGDLEVDVAARRVQLGSVPVVLRAREFDLLARLAAEPGVAISRSTLMADVWGHDWFGQTKTLDVHVAALRRKLVAAAEGLDVVLPEIVTLRGHGFRFELA
ncbi:response regulator transcription factor [Pseudonocardia spinosispora]|uniref:response regulator transcription factor n=1 Tax=Pseudonocardia spinosispora TaxID=103441 RepID=UPI00056BFB2A|nr:response regulator transcription factor [Pseudonocardia spinosispora]